MYFNWQVLFWARIPFHFGYFFYVIVYLCARFSAKKEHVAWKFKEKNESSLTVTEGTKPSNKSTTECRQSRHAFPNRKFSFVSVFMKCAMHRLHWMAQRFRWECRVCVPQSNCEIWIQFYYLLFVAIAADWTEHNGRDMQLDVIVISAVVRIVLNSSRHKHDNNRYNSFARHICRLHGRIHPTNSIESAINATKI